MTRFAFLSFLSLAVVFGTVSCDSGPEPEPTSVQFEAEPSDELSTLIQEAPSDFTWTAFNDKTLVRKVPGSDWSGDIVLSSFQVEDGEVVNRATSEPAAWPDSLSNEQLAESLFSGSRWVPGDEWFPGSKWVPSSNWIPGSDWPPSDVEEAVLSAVDVGPGESLVVVYAQTAGTPPDGGQTTQPYGLVMQQRATTGALEVTTETSGSDPDDGYTVSVADTSVSIGANDSTTLLGLQEDDQDVQLSDVAGNCEVDGDNPRTVSITAGTTTSTTFTVTCSSSSNSQIAFFSERDGGAVREIYRVNTDGSNLTRLTDAEETSQLPVWSPDGSQIAFESTRGDDVNIYVMDADGSNVTQLTSSVGFHPRWSPDGSRIAFISTRDGNEELYAMDADGTNKTRLTNFDGDDDQPRWSPDGSKIAFRRADFVDDPGSFELVVMNADGSNKVELTDRDQNDCCPTWSPDGTKIAYQSERGAGSGDLEVFVTDVDGTNKTNLTGTSDDDTRPAWSPSGDKIAFASERDGNTEIYVMGNDGSNPTRLTTHSKFDSWPVWSPDGTQIAFESDRGNFNFNRDILVMDADGSNLTRLTEDPEEDWRPVWRPSVMNNGQ